MTKDHVNTINMHTSYTIEGPKSFSDLFALDRVLECGVNDIFGRDDLPFGDDVLHLGQEGDHNRVRFHLL